MNFSYTRNTGDGSTTVYTMSFAGQDTGYINPTNIHVLVNGVEVPFTINPTDPNKVYLSSAPAAGSDILIRRIMPNTVPYSDFQNGNPFSQDTLNNTNLQQLYLVQELLDGFQPAGFYYKQDVDMGGYNIKNLGDAVDPDDAVKKEVTDGIISRLEGLESGFDEISSNTIPWKYTATGGETVLSPPYTFHGALVFKNGITQTMGVNDSYTVANSQITLSEPLQAGEQIFALIGTLPAPPSGFATYDQVLVIYAHLTTGIPFANIYVAVVGLEVINARVLVDIDGVHILPSPVTGTITAINWPDVTIV